MRLLVIGANGLLGSNVIVAAKKRNWTVSGTFHSTEPTCDVPVTRFDLQNHERFDDVIDEHDPDVVINCAALTDVDECEEDPESAQVINGEAPGTIASHCEARDIDYIQISTDYVFNGKAEEPYSESANPTPIQTYGKSKLAGEQAVQSEMDDVLLARLSFVWGIHQWKNALTGFPAWVRDKILSDDEVPLFADQHITPTRAGQAAETLLDLIEQNATGLFHVACRSCVSPFEFGKLVAQHIDNNTAQLEIASMSDVKQEADRPKYSCLSVEKVEATLERPQPTLQEDIESI